MDSMVVVREIFSKNGTATVTIGVGLGDSFGIRGEPAIVMRLHMPDGLTSDLNFTPERAQEVAQALQGCVGHFTEMAARLKGA